MTVLTAAFLRLQETACAAPKPDPTRRWSGMAVYHGDWSVVMCSLAPLRPGGHYVSLWPGAYENAALCGAYLDVTGPGNRTVRVQIVDRCRGCTPGHIDLSRSAFAKIGDTGRGVLPVRYQLVRDPTPAPRLGLRVKPGSTAGWLALLVLGHGNPIERVELRPASGGVWRSLERGLDNQWTISQPGSGPYQVRVTDSYGHHAVLPQVKLAPGRTQRTGIRLYGARPAPLTATRSPVAVPPAAPATAPEPVDSHCSRTPDESAS